MAPVPLNVEVPLYNDSFEAPFPGTTWTVSDANAANDADTWGNSSYRSAAGNRSIWSAGVGSQCCFDATLIDDDFERGALGSDYTQTDNGGKGSSQGWGISSNRAYSGSSSVWISGAGGSGTSYDDNMNTYFWKTIDLTGWSSFTFEFWYWINIESCCDHFYPMYYSGGAWTNLADFMNYTIGPWAFRTYDIPTTATRVGFRFYSDESVTYEGVYVDDVRAYGVGAQKNSVLHTYDNGENASAYRTVDVSRYSSARMDYQYWTEMGAGDDKLSVGYYSDDWHYVNEHSGSSAGWQAASVDLPSNATRIGFFFDADDSGNAEGAYVDDLQIVGIVLPLTCTALVSDTTGYEVITTFGYSAFGGDGFAPFTWSWSFSDGFTSALRNPTRTYGTPGNYTATLTVRDAVGQACTTSAPTVDVRRDTTHVAVSPASVTLAEGTSTTAYGADGQGHSYPLDWSLAPPECGSLDVTNGESVVFTASVDAGGFLCTLTGSLGNVQATMEIAVTHDLSAITIDPVGATVIEGNNLALSAADGHGHALDFTWSTTCGRLRTDTGSTNTFLAVTTGGVTCFVKASLQGSQAIAAIAVGHDTSAITLTPTSAVMLEGGTRAFDVVDVYAHPFAADWTVTPSACGSFSVANGASTAFTASTDAGGIACVVTASYLGDSRSANVTVNHDTHIIGLSPPSASLAEGDSQVFSVHDAFGHPYSVGWAVTPASCGDVDPLNGAATTLTLSADSGGLTCTVIASPASGSRLNAVLSIRHGAPASITITAGGTDVEAGKAALLNGAVLDGAGHVLGGLVISWSSTCGVLGATSGESTDLTAPVDSAGTTCTVTATHETVTGSLALHVIHATPYTITITPADPQVSAGGSVQLSAKVTDANGLDVPDAPVTWSASCGSLSSATGATTTFTAPGDGAKCSVSVGTSAGTASTPGVLTISPSGSNLMPILLAVAAAGAAVGLFVVLRMRRKSPALEPAAAVAAGVPAVPAARAGDVVVDAEPSYPIPMASGPCPKCGNPVEAGWAACPECGAEFGAH